MTGAPVSGVLVGSGDAERKDKAGEEMIGGVFVWVLLEADAEAGV